MLRRLEEKEFAEYAGFAYKLALDPRTSGYPMYSDGIKTREDFVERSRKAFMRENEEILLFEMDGKVEGWIHCYEFREDHYLGACSFCVQNGMDVALREFVEYAGRKYPDSEIYLGFGRENKLVEETLLALGFEVLEESYHDAMELSSYERKEEAEGIVEITRDAYGLFADIHDQHTDMYWNTERILSDIEEWSILALCKDGRALGAIYLMKGDDLKMDEIFGIDFIHGVYDAKIFAGLVHAMLNREKERGTRHVVFFNEEESQADALACGFHCLGQYVCYKKSIVLI